MIKLNRILLNQLCPGRINRVRNSKIEERLANSRISKINLAFINRELRKDLEKKLEKESDDLEGQIGPSRSYSLRRNPDFGIKRCGIIGIKIGVSTFWDSRNRRYNATMIQVFENQIVKYIQPSSVGDFYDKCSRHKDRYGLNLVGTCLPNEYTPMHSIDSHRFNTTHMVTREFYVDPRYALQPGRIIGVDHFQEGDYVDVKARS
ncbi:MAG: 54S ribosomal protein L3, partial [Marteilia pararefringens]